ncbi:hypothetical protein ABID56_002582 [Alkalibacillus flavidus]|uniref:Uncharacterized protein n=1 Tax=Alkalibacillus flavidus TaxID=546021 RepID=A0ABV2L0W8_9BACI
MFNRIAILSFVVLFIVFGFSTNTSANEEGAEGFYHLDNNEYVSLDEFGTMSIGGKIELLTEDYYILLDNNEVISSSAIIFMTNTQLQNAMISETEFEETHGVQLLASGEVINVNEDSSSDHQLPTLQVSDSYMEVGDSKSIEFSMSYDNPSQKDLTLLEINGESIEPFKLDGEVAKLYDDGNQNTGDLIEGDGIYSNILNMESDTSGSLNLALGIKEDQEWQQISETHEILILNAMTDEESESVINTNEDLKNNISQQHEAGSTLSEIQDNLLKSLNDSSEISIANSSEQGDAVWYGLNSGVLGAVTLDESEEEIVANQAPKQEVMASMDHQAVVGGNDVVLYTAHKDSVNQALIGDLEQNNYAVDTFTDEEASVEQFKNMVNYNTVIFDTDGVSLFEGDVTTEYPYLSNLFSHEEEQVVIMTGEEVTSEQNKLYNADLKTGRLVVVDGYYAITPAFIDYYGENMAFSNTLIYANTDYSMNNDTLGEQFIDSGAPAYIGYEGEIVESYVNNTFNKMLDGEVLSQAVQDEMVLGDSSFLYTNAAPLDNGSFENGLSYWKSGGHFNDITRLGLKSNPEWETIRPTDGEHMAIISSGVDDSALDGRQSWAYQTFEVPEDMDMLKFDYNVVSNEPMSYLNSAFDDTFKATIVEGNVKEPSENINNSGEQGYLPGGSTIYDVPWLESTIDDNETMIAYESINSSDWGQHYDDDRNRVDVIYPTGDQTTYMTDWKTVSYDVSEYQGQTISLKMQTWDLGDRIYPTAVLFDRIHFTNSTRQGIGIQGNDKVVVPSNDSARFKYNVSYVDQYDDFITSEIDLQYDDGGYRQPYYVNDATYDLKDNVEGVKIHAETGELTVESNVDASEIIITAELDGEMVEKVVELVKQ